MFLKNIYLVKNKVLVTGRPDKTAQKVEAELRELGYRKFIVTDLIVAAYLALNLKPIGFRFTNVCGSIIADYFTLDITEVCSLKCKYCGAFIPYIKGSHYSVDECIKSVRKMADIVDGIGCITIQGDEPFLHPQFTEICHSICDIGKVKKITIAINGTVVPSEEYFLTLSPYKEKILIMGN